MAEPEGTAITPFTVAVPDDDAENFETVGNIIGWFENSPKSNLRFEN